MFAKAGKFATGTSIATLAPITGVGGEPKVILMWANHSTGALADHMIHAIFLRGNSATSGASGDRHNISVSAEDAATTTDTYRYYQWDEGVLLNGVSGSSDCRWDIDSFDEDGFTPKITSILGGVSRDVYYLAIGGDDVEWDVVNFNNPNSAPNTAFDITTSLTDPNFFMYFGMQRDGDPSISFVAHACVIWGMASKDPAGQCSFAIGSDDAVAQSRCRRYGSSEQVWTGFTIANETSINAAAVDSWLSNGIRWNVSKANGESPINNLFGLFLKVPHAAVVTKAIAASGAVETVLGADEGYLPQAALVVGVGQAEHALNTATVNAEFMMGAATADNVDDNIAQGATWAEDVHGEDPTIAKCFADDATCYNNRDAATGNADGSLALSRWVNGGARFTKVAPADERFVAFAFLGGDVPAPPPGAPSIGHNSPTPSGVIGKNSLGYRNPVRA